MKSTGHLPSFNVFNCSTPYKKRSSEFREGTAFRENLVKARRFAEDGMMRLMFGTGAWDERRFQFSNHPLHSLRFDLGGYQSVIIPMISAPRKGSMLVADFERVYWQGVEKSSKLAMGAIRELIDYLEGMKKELCLKSTKLLSEDAVGFLGPATEVAVAGLGHAIDYLSICRTRINDTDVALAKRFLTKMDAE